MLTIVSQSKGRRGANGTRLALMRFHWPRRYAMPQRPKAQLSTGPHLQCWAATWSLTCAEGRLRAARSPMSGSFIVCSPLNVASPHRSKTSSIHFGYDGSARTANVSHSRSATAASTRRHATGRLWRIDSTDYSDAAAVASISSKQSRYQPCQAALAAAKSDAVYLVGQSATCPELKEA
jgi:hypothetical protein